MTFETFSEKLTANFLNGVSTSPALQTDADKDKLWEIYLESFPAGSNPIFRKRTEHDCTCCRRFIRELGGVVWYDSGYRLHTIFDLYLGDTTYQPVCDALADYVRSCHITGYYLATERTVGTAQNHEFDGVKIRTFNHFSVKLPQNLICSVPGSLGEELNERKVSRDLLLRSVTEISLDAVATVMELIDSNSLYRGSEKKYLLESLIQSIEQFAISDNPDAFSWNFAATQSKAVCRIINSSIGVLLRDISAGAPLDDAVAAYERMVAPENYKRSKPVFTARMLDAAKQKCADLGYLDSLPRRYAAIDDISVSNVLFANRDVRPRMASDPFSAMQKQLPENPKKFSRVEEVSAESFVRDVLPHASELSVLVEPRHAANMVSLIAPAIPGSKSMFPWRNGFSWAYEGNLADSTITRNVKAAGGQTDGVLRFSIMWNDGEYDPSDLDAHCFLPEGHIYFGNMKNYTTGGKLDVDNIQPRRGCVAVENIVFPAASKMKEGRYILSVNCFCDRGSRGFSAEVVCGGETYSFTYNKPLRHKQTIDVAVVDYDGATFKVTPNLPASTSFKDIWGIPANQFAPCTVACFSPNHWEGETPSGSKHLFFMLGGCVNPGRPNGFFNEYLSPELREHRKVFEALGAQMAVAETANQLSGLGFCLTRRSDVVVKVRGASERIIRIKF